MARQPAVLDAATASELLDGVAAGSVELDGALDGDPIVGVDLDTVQTGTGQAGTARAPLWLPLVVAGLSTAAPPPAVPDWVDVALTSAVAPPEPWVEVADVEHGLMAIAERVQPNPQASVTLCQVLRASGKDGPVATDLLRESLAYSALQAGQEHRRWLEGRQPRQSRPASGEPVLVERRGTELVISLNRPEVHNAYNAAMRDALCRELREVAQSPVFDRIEIRGVGPSFCSGGDIDEFGSLVDPATAHLVRTTRSAASLLSVLAERVTFRLHGACAGAGIELAAFAGRVVADRSTMMWLPEVSMGLIPGAGGTASLPRRIGRRRTAWMALSGAPVSAELAVSWGLADESEPATAPRRRP